MNVHEAIDAALKLIVLSFKSSPIVPIVFLPASAGETSVIHFSRSLLSLPFYKKPLLLYLSLSSKSVAAGDISIIRSQKPVYLTEISPPASTSEAVVISLTWPSEACCNLFHRRHLLATRATNALWPSQAVHINLPEVYSRNWSFITLLIIQTSREICRITIRKASETPFPITKALLPQNKPKLSYKPLLLYFLRLR